MPVAIVESEKSAFVLPMSWKDYMVSYRGSQNLNAGSQTVLMGRDVTVFPDIDAENEWFKISVEANQWKFWSVRKMMDSVGYNYAEGDDIADVTLWKKRK